MILWTSIMNKCKETCIKQCIGHLSRSIPGSRKCSLLWNCPRSCIDHWHWHICLQRTLVWNNNCHYCCCCCCHCYCCCSLQWFLLLQSRLQFPLRFRPLLEGSGCCWSHRPQCIHHWKESIHRSRKCSQHWSCPRSCTGHSQPHRCYRSQHIWRNIGCTVPLRCTGHNWALLRNGPVCDCCGHGFSNHEEHWLLRWAAKEHRQWQLTSFIVLLWN